MSNFNIGDIGHLGGNVMARRKAPDQPIIESRQWKSADEIDRAIKKLQRRIEELKALDVRVAALQDTGADNFVISNVRETIRELFGAQSPEFHEHGKIWLWAGGMNMEMSDGEIVQATERGRNKVVTILNGLIDRLNEKREGLSEGGSLPPRAILEHLNLHPRIADVARDLFLDGHPWEAVFAASKALVNYVKERSNQHQMDGATLVRTVFSRKKPILAFNDLVDQTDHDEQEGMMHLFEGVIMGIRNPGGHSFPEGPQQRTEEYLSLISLLAYRVQESRRVPTSA